NPAIHLSGDREAALGTKYCLNLVIGPAGRARQHKLRATVGAKGCPACHLSLTLWTAHAWYLSGSNQGVGVGTMTLSLLTKQTIPATMPSATTSGWLVRIA